MQLNLLTDWKVMMELAIMPPVLPLQCIMALDFRALGFLHMLEHLMSKHVHASAVAIDYIPGVVIFLIGLRLTLFLGMASQTTCIALCSSCLVVRGLLSCIFPLILYIPIP